jgi:hypothetical protein
MSVPENVLDKNLYLKAKKIAKSKFKVWPSAYDSAFLVKTYKDMEGRYLCNKKGGGSLTRWFAEEWVDVCYLPKVVTCGRPVGGYKRYEKNYPYCRPMKRVTSQTPKTVRELSKSELERRCRKKRKNPRDKLHSK